MNQVVELKVDYDALGDVGMDCLFGAGRMKQATKRWKLGRSMRVSDHSAVKRYPADQTQIRDERG